MSLVDYGSAARGYAPVPTDDEHVTERHYPEFQKALSNMRRDIVAQNAETLYSLRGSADSQADVIDRASADADHALLLRTRDRQRKHLAVIDAALARIEDGSFGICVETGDAMPLARMRARPTATMCVEAQERHERRERASRS